MSQIIKCKSRLSHINLTVMKEVIKATQKQLGGPGLLEEKTVKGYFDRKKADLVFQFEGMRFSMGISQTKNGVIFIGDSWGSSNWNQVQDTIEANYVLMTAALSMQQLGFTPEEQTFTNPQGRAIEGVRA
ncbi:MAG: hypothetical protein HXS54_01210 [Theionarchaea archaeon]|nr:hypothetical protein [Theionarchaea archaeon]